MGESSAIYKTFFNSYFGVLNTNNQGFKSIRKFAGIMTEPYLTKVFELIREDEWKLIVESTKSDVGYHIEKDSNSLYEKLIKAVEIRVEENCGVLFSGGVDSVTIALILKHLGVRFTCFTIGTKESKDIAIAKEIAQQYGFNLKIKTFSESGVIDLFKEVIQLVNRVDTVSVSVGAVALAGLRFAKENNCNLVFTGLGAEEIFGGYQRHIEANDLNQECWRGLRDVFWQRDLKRDCAIAKHVGVNVATPFLDPEVTKTAMMIPANMKYVDGYRKVILREVAEELGLKHEYAFRRKLAGQYGSGFDKVLEKAAKQKGFKMKREYLNSLN